MDLELRSPDIILFKEDWDKWPTAIPDRNTRNQSAVEYASMLFYMGVKNYWWPLTLINPALSGVDPYSPDLTVEEMVAIRLECSMNPWYFFREVARAPASGGGEPIPLRFNRGNCYLWWCFFNHINVILVQPRQTGKSLSVDELMVGILEMFCVATKVSLITKDEKLRVENTDRLKSILELLPPYLRNRTGRDRASSELIEVKKNKNTYTAYIANPSPGAAHNLGRGGSNAIMQFDEPPFQSNFQITYGAVIGSMSAMIDNAKRSNALYGTIMTTTAAKRDTPSGKFFYQIVDKSVPWSEHYFDCKDIKDLHKTIWHASRLRTVNGVTDEETVAVGAVSTYGCFNHRQLGYTDEWMRDVLSRNLNPVAEDINRDFFNISTNGGVGHPLDQAILDRIMESRKEPAYTEVDPKHRYSIRWYIPRDDIDREMSRRDVVVGVDMSEGVNRDFITLCFMDTSNGEVLGSATIKETNINVFSYWFCHLLVRFPKLFAIIENRNMGPALIDTCTDFLPTVGIDPYKRLFNRIVQEKDDSALKAQTYEMIKAPLNRRHPDVGKHGKYKSLFGYKTSGSGTYSRDELYKTTLNKAAPRIGHMVADGVLIDQIAGLVLKDGRIDHPYGMHDDLVIAWLLCLWFIYHGKHIAHYGLSPSRVLAQVPDTDGNVKENDPHETEQAELRQELEKYIDLLGSEDDPALIDHYEHHVRFLESQISPDNENIDTVGDLIAKAGENRRKRRINSRLRRTDDVDIDKWRDGVTSTYSR